MSLVFWQICNDLRLATFSTESVMSARFTQVSPSPLFRRKRRKRCIAANDVQGHEETHALQHVKQKDRLARGGLSEIDQVFWIKWRQ